MKKYGLMIILVMCQASLANAANLFDWKIHGNILYVRATATHVYNNSVTATMNTSGYTFIDATCPRASGGCKTIRLPSLSNTNYTPLIVNGPNGSFSFTISLANRPSQGRVSAGNIIKATAQTLIATVLTSNFLTTPWAVVSNYGAASISFCAITTTAGATYGQLSTPCTSETAPINGESVFSYPAGGIYSPTTGTLYITNQEGYLSQCTFSGTISTIVCANFSDASFNLPSGVSISADNTLLYVTNGGNSYVSICALDPITGTILNNSSTYPCATSYIGLAYLSGITINTSVSPNMLYFSTDPGGGQIDQCTITNGKELACTDTNALTVNGPTALALSSDNSTLYASNYYPSTVTTCPVSTGSVTGASCTSSSNGGTYDSPSGIALYVGTTSTFAYVSNWGNYTVSMCPITSNAIQTCTAFTDTSGGIDQPNGITVINPS